VARNDSSSGLDTRRGDIKPGKPAIVPALSDLMRDGVEPWERASGTDPDGALGQANYLPTFLSENGRQNQSSQR